jgi:hypothetical protein
MTEFWSYSADLNNQNRFISYQGALLQQINQNCVVSNKNSWKIMVVIYLAEVSRLNAKLGRLSVSILYLIYDNYYDKEYTFVTRSDFLIS